MFPESIPIPDEVLDIARRLEDAGFETWCVGGAIRDNLLDFANSDFDLATAAPPDEIQRLFHRTVPIGVEHGTVAVLDKHGVPHEVTTFRADVKTDGRHAVVEFGVSLDQDLARRDFTINAIAYHPLRHEWRDPYHGAGDLEAKLVRAVGDPATRFTEDYLRIVRALRFAARFAFAIEPATWDAAVVAAEGLDRLSAERVRDEWFKGLATAQRPSEFVSLWRDVGALARWLPEITALDARLDEFPRDDPVLITSYLSANAQDTLTRLRCSNAEIERGRAIAEGRGSLPETSDRAVRHWLAAVGSAADDLLTIADISGEEAALRDVVIRVRASGAPLTLGDLAISGRDIMQAGVGEGPEVGRVLRTLMNEVLDDPSANERERLLGRVHELIQEHHT